MPLSLSDYTDPARGWFSIERQDNGTFLAELGWCIASEVFRSERGALRWAQAHGGKRRFGP